jgi:hypothetical protein
MKSMRDSVLRLFTVLSAVLMLCFAETQAQTELERTLTQYNKETVTGYIQPVVDLFGANMHAGYYHSAFIPKSGFSLGIDLIGMGSIVTDAQKTYTATAPPGFDPPTFKAPTIFGGKAVEIFHKVIAGLSFKGSGGIVNASIFPLAVPQLRIGSLYGTEAILRFVTIPAIGDDKFPVITLWGAGVRHSISQYIPSSPVDIAAGAFFNSFTLGDIISFKGVALSAHASKSISVLILYGGVAWESSKMNLKYSSTDPTLPAAVDINLTGANAFRFTLGAGLKLGFFRIFADANFGSVTNYSGGIGFGL